MSDGESPVGIAGLLRELRVRRAALIAGVTAVAFSAMVYVLFVYVPGSHYGWHYWLALTFVLAVAIFLLVVGVLVTVAAYRHARSLDGDPAAGGRPRLTVAFVVGLVGWLAIPVPLAVDAVPATPRVVLATATVASLFLAVAIGAVGLAIVAALSLSHVWRPRLATLGGLVYATVVVLPSVGCLGGEGCLGTPDRLAVAVAAGDPAAVSAGYTTAVLGAGVVVGAGLAYRGAAPPHGVLAGLVAAMVAIVIVAFTTGEPGLVRTAGATLPGLLGATGAVGGGVGIGLRGRGSSRRDRDVADR